MSGGHSLSTDRSGTETGAMPSLGGTALAVGCLSESMEGALREHGVLGGVAMAITKMYTFKKGCQPAPFFK